MGPGMAHAREARAGSVRPSWRSAPWFLAGVYTVLAVAWIVGSDSIVGRLAPSVEWLGRIEMVKGLGFVVGTGAVIFVMLTLWERRHRRAAALLAENEERFAQFAEHSEDAFWFAEGETGRPIFVSAAFERMWDLSLKEVFADPFAFRQRLHPEDVHRVMNEVGELVCGVRTFLECDTRVVHRTGEVRVIQIRGTRIKPGPDGKPRLAGINIDVTDRRVLEARLRQSEARFRTMCEAAPVAMWVADEQLNRTYNNPRWIELAGGDAARVAGEEWLRLIHPEDRGRVLQCYASATEPDRVVVQEFRLMGAKGEWRWIYDCCVAMRDEKGVHVGYIGSSLDISEQKEDRERQNILLRELDHRVKNNLASVIALAEGTFATTASREEFRGKFMDRVMAMARAHDALAKGRWEGLYMEELVSTVLEPLLDAEANSLRFGGDEAYLPASAIPGLAMVLNELGANALKHGSLRRPGGSVQLTWRLCSDDKGRRVVSLSWVEAGGATVSPPERDGLGMQIVQGIVASELQGSLLKDYAPSGARYTISFGIGAAEDRTPISAGAVGSSGVS